MYQYKILEAPFLSWVLIKICISAAAEGKLWPTRRTLGFPRCNEKFQKKSLVILNINEGIEINKIFESNFCLIITSDSGMLHKVVRHLTDHKVLMLMTGHITVSLCCAPPLLLLWHCIHLESSQALPASPRLSQHASFSLPAFVEQRQKHAA